MTTSMEGIANITTAASSNVPKDGSPMAKGRAVGVECLVSHLQLATLPYKIPQDTLPYNKIQDTIPFKYIQDTLPYIPGNRAKGGGREGQVWDKHQDCRDKHRYWQDRMLIQAPMHPAVGLVDKLIATMTCYLHCIYKFGPALRGSCIACRGSETHMCLAALPN